MTKYSRIRDKIIAALDREAQKTALESSDVCWSLFKSVSPSDYRSQGLGANSYARGSADMAKLTAEYHGISTHLRFTQRHIIKDYVSEAYEVWVALPPEQVEILSRKPGPPLRELVKHCWKTGVNPRVYCPFLPYDYESQAGIDYFGN
jgi:hypothetical protein